MQPTEAAAILRGKGASMRDIFEAERMGADALEAWAWVERTKSQITVMPHGYVVERIVACRWVRLGHGPTPLAAVVDAMSKGEAQ